MSAIQSLLRVMALRDAEAIILEAGKVPSLRRRGQVEKLAMPALDAKLLVDFAAPLTEGRTVDDWPASLPFLDADGTSYQVTLEKVPAGLRVVVRRNRAAAAPAAFKPAPEVAERPAPWWATPSPRSTTSPVPIAIIEPASSPPSPQVGLARLATLLDPAVAVAHARGASDVLASTGQPIRIRCNNRLETIDVLIDNDELAAGVIALGSNTDHSFEIAGTRVRVSAFDHLGGYGIALRLISDQIPTLQRLGLPPELRAAADHRDGLVLVCGPTGAGKSTTLTALIDEIDQRRAAHVITLEDPIEYRFRPHRCLIHQREVRTHVASFASGLVAALRESPDVIMLGEIRDRETISAALTAAETGHLVLATLHASSARGAIDRMIDAFPETQQRQVRWQLAAVLRTVITQFLVPTRDGGRLPAVEHVPITTPVANLIRTGELHTLPTVITTGRDAGMIPLERSLAALVNRGAVTAQAVQRIAADRELLASLTRPGLIS
ncbi:MAG: type IV pilus twitching motility protein PilT [Kofleriaceae bacterium]